MSTEHPPPPSPGGYGSTPPSPPPNNNLVLAVISLLCCWPIGIPAVVFAARVNGKWNTGDQPGAQADAEKAKKFALIAIVLGVVFLIGYLIFFFAVLAPNMAELEQQSGL